MIRQNFFENLSKVFRGKHFEIGIFLYVRTKHGGDGNFLEHFFAVLLFFLFGLFGDNEKFVFVQSDRYILIRAKTRISESRGSESGSGERVFSSSRFAGE